MLSLFLVEAPKQRSAGRMACRFAHTRTAGHLDADVPVNAAAIRLRVKDLFHSWICDADLDGQFDSGDLGEALTAGKYDDPALSATWRPADRRSVFRLRPEAAQLLIQERADRRHEFIRIRSMSS